MSEPLQFKFRLYVAGDAQNSVQALSNLTAFCRAYFLDRYEIEVVDVFKEPERALTDSVYMTPTLVKVLPEPVRKIIGALGQTQLLAQKLGLETAVA